MKMTEHISRADFSSFRKRWLLVQRAERSELRRTTYSQKIRQLSSLFLSAKLRQWGRALESEDQEVQKRWQRIRRYYRAKG